MTIEEKAKAYDEAIEVAQRFYNNCVAITKKGLEDIFPVLTESKEEKIRKAIYNCVKWFGFDSCFFKGVSQEECLAWLEKQEEDTYNYKRVDLDKFDERIQEFSDMLEDEPKPYWDGWFEAMEWIRTHGNPFEKQKEKYFKEEPAWSEEDEKMMDIILNDINYAQKNFSDSKLTSYDKKVEWLKNKLKSLKDRVQPQPKQEWSDEDNEHIKSIISTIECSKAQFPNSQAVLEAYNSDLIWLKSLRPHSSYHEGFKKGFAKAKEMHYDHWKPSKEQIRVVARLRHCLLEDVRGNDVVILDNLLEQLKNL